MMSMWNWKCQIRHVHHLQGKKDLFHLKIYSITIVDSGWCFQCQFPYFLKAFLVNINQNMLSIIRICRLLLEYVIQI